MKTIKAISLWEPWASLMRTGAKTIETRSWNTNYRGSLLICAAKGGLSKSELRQLLSLWEFKCGLAPLLDPSEITKWSGIKEEHLNFGKAVAIVVLYDCVPTDLLMNDELKNNKVLGGNEDVFGNYKPGRFAWKTKMINNSFKPFPVKGKQRFFDVELP